MSLHTINQHPVRAYIDEKQRIYQHIQNCISNVMACLIEELVPLFPEEYQSDLLPCEVLVDALTIAIGNNSTELPSHRENAIRSKVWGYLEDIDIKDLTVEGIYSKNDNFEFHSCTITFRQPSMFQRLEAAFKLTINSHIQLVMRSSVYLGPPLMRSAPESVMISLPWLQWLDLHDMREYQAIFDDEWKKLIMLATMKGTTLP